MEQHEIVEKAEGEFVCIKCRVAWNDHDGLFPDPKVLTDFERGEYECHPRAERGSAPPGGERIMTGDKKDQDAADNRILGEAHLLIFKLSLRYKAGSDRREECEDMRMKLSELGIRRFGPSEDL